MEMLFNIELLVGEIVDQRSLLYEVVLSLDSNVVHLLFGVHEMLGLFLFGNISPHGAELLSLVSRVHVIEHSKLGSEEVSEMSDFDVSEIEGNQELVMPDHASGAFVVGPSSESRDGVDSRDVEKYEKKSSSGS